MSETKSRQRDCSVARTIEVISDRWTFLILREAFFGVRYYDKFQVNLGIATNILSQRLKMLVEHEILKKQKDPDDARRIIYRLTEQGIDLYPITLALMKWGDRWLADKKGPPLILHHKTCGHRLDPVMCCAHCGKSVNAREVSFDTAQLA